MLKFYNNKPENGPIIDWDEVYKIYESLNVPPEYDYVTGIPLDWSSYNMCLSERSIGKTTSYLLLGMCLYKWSEGMCQIQYVRLSEEMTAPINSKDLMRTVVSYMGGRYIKQLTDDKYNSVVYYDRRWYYTWLDADGKEDRSRRAPDFFMISLSIDRNDFYASSYNAPYAVMTILDEFIMHNGRYPVNAAVQFWDLLKTIYRDRHGNGVRVFMLANTIAPYSPWFREFMIHKEVRGLRIGQEARIITDKGTKIYVAYLKSKKSYHVKEKVNAQLYGFENPQLAAITGSDEWAIKYAPHIMHEEDEEIIDRTTYIDYNAELLQVELVRSPNLGYHLQIHPASKTYNDSVIYTDDPEKQIDRRYVYSMNNKMRKRDKILRYLIATGKAFYSDNYCKSLLDDYLISTKSV